MEDLFTYKGLLVFWASFYSWGLDFLNGQNIFVYLLNNIGGHIFIFTHGPQRWNHGSSD